MPSIKGTKTEKNILTAFSGESQARNRYTYFSSVARKEGFVLVSELFMETANQEKEHAKRLFKFLEGGEVKIEYSYPAGIIADTAKNLEEAAAGENDEWSHMYPEFAKIAREEGFIQIASVMESIAIAEKQHEKQYLDLLKHINEGTMFKRNEKVIWRCRNCGFIMEGTEAPMACPACNHPQAHFEVLRMDF